MIFFLQSTRLERTVKTKRARKPTENLHRAQEAQIETRQGIAEMRLGPTTPNDEAGAQITDSQSLLVKPYLDFLCTLLAVFVF